MNLNFFKTYTEKKISNHLRSSAENDSKFTEFLKEIKIDEIKLNREKYIGYKGKDNNLLRPNINRSIYVENENHDIEMGNYKYNSDISKHEYINK
jgi:hypothetical protein